MPIGISEASVTGFDCNVLDATTLVTDEFLGDTKLSVSVTLVTGAFGATVLELQCSPDNVDANFQTLKKTDLATNVTFSTAGIFTDIEDLRTKFIRIKTTTAAAETCTVDITIQGKG